jgi:hypothetical protein
LASKAAVVSVTWSCVVGPLVLGQKLLPPRVLVDLPVALAILIGIAVTVARSAVPVSP